MSLLFVPLDADQLAAWATTGSLPAGRPAHLVDSGLCEAFDVVEGEQAEQIALLVASIAGLSRTGRRLVAVAEGAWAPRDGSDPDFGEVQTAPLNYAAITGLFADEAQVPGLAAAAAAAAGLPLAQAWERPEVIELLSEADLLWHGSAEWSSLIAAAI